MRGRRRILEKMKLINVSIRTKLLLIYLLCVLIPTIVFSYAFFSSTVNSARKEELIQFQQSVDRIGAAIDANAMSAIELSNVIFPDESMYEYINREYTDSKHSLDDYNSYMRDAWNRILPYNTNIVVFSVYTDNGTVLNGRHLTRIDSSVMRYDWYKKYTQQAENPVFICHSDEFIASTAQVKSVSFFRKLDYYYSKNYSPFLKVTFQANMFSKIMKTEPLPGNLYVVNNENQIVSQSISSGNDYTGTEFLPFDSVQTAPGQTVLSTPVKFMEGWKVVCILNRDFMGNSFSINWGQLAILVLSVTAFSSAVILALSSSLYKRIAVLVDHMGRVSKEEYNLIPEKDRGNDEIGLLITSMNSMITKIRLLIEDVYKAKIRETQLELHKKQSELNALQCQVNPHFMFNVLETVRIKSYLRNEFETSRIVKYMSRLFRKLLLWNDDLISLKEETDFIKEYLEIQQYRFEDELKFDISVDESLMRMKIPKMALQAFVDNACEHGFSESTGLKQVRISARVEGEAAVLGVYDNGKGMAPEQVQGIECVDSRGIGIRNVIGRLKLYYGDNYRFEIRSVPGEFTEIVLTLDMEEMRRCGYV
jgi:two-component system sensor histidine kinase YesM